MEESISLYYNYYIKIQYKLKKVKNGIKVNILFNRDKEKYKYDIEMLVNSFFPAREQENKEELTLYINRETDAISVFLFKGYLEESDDVENQMELYRDRLLEREYEKCVSCDKKEIKNVMKQLTYKALSRFTKKTLPWGILTGIRPTKLAMAVLEQENIGGDKETHEQKNIYADMEVSNQNISEAQKEEEFINEKIRRLLQDYYYVSDEKTKLAIDIAWREKKILKDIDYNDGYSLYIGIPFCPTTCLYCSFTSYPIGMYKDKADKYVDCLIKEIDFCSRKFANKKLNTIYFGGGTPTTLSAEQLDRLFTEIENRFDFTNLLEYTVEAGRPDSITHDKLKVLKNHSITRISVNPQTMKQETLDIIGRRHTVEQVREAFYMAREAGFDNINMDFIAGLPNETIEDMRNTMEEAVKLNPDSITVHSLAIKRAARLNMFKENYKEMTIENNTDIMRLCSEYAGKLNMKPYYMYRQKNMAGNMENVGYAKEGKAGIYNILIMEEKQTIAALGAGAVTKYVFPKGGRIERVDNVKNVEQYIERIDEMIGRKEKFIDNLRQE